MLVKLKDQIKDLIYRIVPPPYVNETFSQSGEDCCIDFLLSQLKISHPTYLELGVYKPRSASNTYLFYKRGSTGVLVEADRTLIAEIKKVRPNDVVLNVGVGTENSESELYIFEEPAHNTFSKIEAEYRIKNGSYKFLKKEKVALFTINHLISENFKSYPHILSIDIEGLDLDVLKDLDTGKYPIPIICAETCAYSETHIKPKNKLIEELMISKGYFVYADTYINTIFVNDRWFNSFPTKK
jgi:FkbM family methyltransferase